MDVVFVAMAQYEHEGLGIPGWDWEHPIPSFGTEQEARDWARKKRVSAQDLMIVEVALPTD